jgi:hypothetical protein
MTALVSVIIGSCHSQECGKEDAATGFTSGGIEAKREEAPWY